jgi:FtsH-binding integral membrane protein
MYPGTVQPQHQAPMGSWGGGMSEAEAQAQYLQKVLGNFGFSLLLAAAGAWAGWRLSPGTYGILMLVEFALLLAAVFVRRSSTASPLLVYAFAAISGATTVPIIQWAMHYTGSTAVVYNALGATGAVFCAMAWYGNVAKRDLSGWGTFLYVGLFGALIASLIGLFITHSAMYHIMVSAVCVIVFTGFIAYDINMIKRNWRTYDINIATLNLYLDFLNLFVNLLQIMAMLSGNGGGRRNWD